KTVVGCASLGGSMTLVHTDRAEPKRRPAIALGTGDGERAARAATGGHRGSLSLPHHKCAVHLLDRVPAVHAAFMSLSCPPSLLAARCPCPALRELGNGPYRAQFRARAPIPIPIPNSDSTPRANDTGMTHARRARQMLPAFFGVAILH